MSELQEFRIRFKTERGDFRNISRMAETREEAIFAAGLYIGDPECTFISATVVPKVGEIFDGS